MHTFSVIIGVLFILAPFALIIFLSVRYHKKMLVNTWQVVLEIFTSHHINIIGQLPENKAVLINLNGEFSGHQIHVFNEYVGTGKSRTLITRTEIKLKDKVLPDFKIYRENIFTKVGEVIGIRDVKTGDEEFDKMYRLRAVDEIKVIDLFDAFLRSELITRKKDFYGSVEVKENVLNVYLHGVPGVKISRRHYIALFETAMILVNKKVKKIY